MQTPEFRRNEPAKYEYEKSYYTEMFKVLQSLLKNQDFCDITLETDDKQIIFAHKVVLASGSPYFHAMFTNFAEKNHDHVVMGQLDSTALKLLVNFIYSGKIVVTEINVLVLLPAANLLQLEEVREACCDFLQSQLSPTNCIGINAIADLHSCTQLLKSSELYVLHHFTEVIGGDEFLSLSFEQVIKLISNDELIVPSEEKVFESVIHWVKHELSSRQCNLPQLMEHVRLPLISKHYILKKVAEEPLINNCLKCNKYIIEALYFHLLKSEEPIPQNIRIKPRHGDKVILVVAMAATDLLLGTEWYDPKIDQWNFLSEMITYRYKAGVEVVNDNLVFAVGGKSLKSVDVLDLSLKSPCWEPSVDMLTKRYSLGVGVINNYLYAVGGCNGSSVYGLDTVECYHPSLDTWIPVAKMRVHRKGVRVGVLDGVLYAVGGLNESCTLSSVETYRPSTGIWTPIADMHFPRSRPGVVVLNGLLYVIGGLNGNSSLDSVECYCPNTNEWSIVTASMKYMQTVGGAVAINRTQHFKSIYDK
ncbi:kelch-like protein 2 isoform X2 [Myzus persicae]|uniref:kelch-like protein 2 isoform X2 n=1 Tax=Myzus persicae TaxID=13164 RepID=UPI000B93166B|nr:kelch-like protein 2 isoform X2 [Myzus persicae]